MMSQRSKGELVEVIRPRYLKASKREKTTIIDEFITSHQLPSQTCPSAAQERVCCQGNQEKRSMEEI